MPRNLSAVITCPPQLDQWTPLANFALAKINDNATKILAKGLPRDSFCQREVAGVVSYYVQNERSGFVDLLLLPPKQSLLQMPQMSDDEFSGAIALVAARRHPAPHSTQQLVLLDKAPPPIVDQEEAGVDWVVMDAALVPSLVTLIRFEMQDDDNVLFRQARFGDAYYVTANTEALSQMIAILQEIKRDLTVVGLQSAADSVNMLAVQTTYIQTHLQATQPFWKKPFHELWPLAVMGAVGAVGIGWGFHEGGILSTKLHHGVARLVEWIRNNRNPPTPPTAGIGGMGSHGAMPTASHVPTSDEFSSLDDRVDAGEAADFQIDPTRSYNRLQHFHINGAAVAAVVIAGGVVLLIPEIIPLVAAASPEAVSFATGLGAFAASR